MQTIGDKIRNETFLQEAMRILGRQSIIQARSWSISIDIRDFEDGRFLPTILNWGGEFWALAEHRYTLENDAALFLKRTNPARYGHVEIPDAIPVPSRQSGPEETSVDR